MKKLTFAICFVIVLLVCSAFAADNPKVQVNGNILDFTDSEGNKVEAQIINNRTMVPLRKIFEELKCKVDWEPTTQMVTATNDNIVIRLIIGDEKAYCSYKGAKEQEIKLDSPPVIVEKRTLVPLRFIGESLGNTVGWDSENRTAIIIGYDELAQIVKSKSEFLYKFFALTSDVTIEKYYYDEWDPSYNSVSKLTVDAGELSDSEGEYFLNKVGIKITGDSDFAKEVKEEGWDDFNFDLLRLKDDQSFENVLLRSNNYVFSKMFGKNKNEKIDVNFEEFGLSKGNSSNLADYLKNVFNLDSSKVNVKTYDSLKSDLNKFAKSFLSGNKKLSQSDFEYTALDLRNIYNARLCIATDILQLLNKKAFRYDLNYQDLFVDYPDISYNFEQGENNIKVTLTLKNEYKETYKYVITLHVENLT